MEGNIVINNLDIVRDAPGRNVPYVTASNRYISDGIITIDLTKSVGDPQINGIEVIFIGQPSPTVPPTTSPVVAPAPAPSAGDLLHRINCGSANQVIVPPLNTVWDPDIYAVSGNPYNHCNSSTINSDIYCSSRFFRSSAGMPFRYSIPIPVANRTYEVRLHFAETVCLYFSLHGTINA